MLPFKNDRPRCFRSHLFKQVVALLYSHGGAEKTATEHFLWNSSMQSLETQLLKPLAYLPSQNDFSPTPSPLPLQSHRRWALDKKKGRLYRKMDSHESRSHCSPATSQKDSFLVLSIQYVHSTPAGAHILYVGNADLLYGMTGLSILQPWPQMKRRGPSPLGASEGQVACCRVSLDDCLSRCWWLCGC